MKLPIQVECLCNRFSQKVRQDINHNITAKERFEIYQNFGFSRLNLPGYTKRGVSFNGAEYRQLLENEFLNFNIVDYTLGWLAILTAKKVLPIWDRIEEYFTDEAYSVSAHHIIGVAEALLQGKISYTEASTDNDEFYLEGSFISSTATNDIVCAYYSACEALRFILHGVKYRYIQNYFSTEDDKVFGGDFFTTQALEAYTVIDKNPPGKYKVQDVDIIMQDFLNFKIIDNISDGHQPLQLPLPLDYSLEKRLEFWEWWLTEAIPQAWELAYKNVPTQE